MHRRFLFLAAPVFLVASFNCGLGEEKNDPSCSNLEDRYPSDCPEGAPESAKSGTLCSLSGDCDCDCSPGDSKFATKTAHVDCNDNDPLRGWFVPEDLTTKDIDEDCNGDPLNDDPEVNNDGDEGNNIEGDCFDDNPNLGNGDVGEVCDGPFPGGEGACQYGYYQCVGKSNDQGKWEWEPKPECRGIEPGQLTEKCNDVDDDCNGKTDDVSDDEPGYVVSDITPIKCDGVAVTREVDVGGIKTCKFITLPYVTKYPKATSDVPVTYSINVHEDFVNKKVSYTVGCDGAAGELLEGKIVVLGVTADPTKMHVVPQSPSPTSQANTGCAISSYNMTSSTDPNNLQVLEIADIRELSGTTNTANLNWWIDLPALDSGGMSYWTIRGTNLSDGSNLRLAGNIYHIEFSPELYTVICQGDVDGDCARPEVLKETLIKKIPKGKDQAVDKGVVPLFLASYVGPPIDPQGKQCPTQGNGAAFCGGTFPASAHGFEVGIKGYLSNSDGVSFKFEKPPAGTLVQYRACILIPNW